MFDHYIILSSSYNLRARLDMETRLSDLRPELSEAFSFSLFTFFVISYSINTLINNTIRKKLKPSALGCKGQRV